MKYYISIIIAYLSLTPIPPTGLIYRLYDRNNMTSGNQFLVCTSGRALKYSPECFALRSECKFQSRPLIAQPKQHLSFMSSSCIPHI